MKIPLPKPIHKIWIYLFNLFFQQKPVKAKARKRRKNYVTDEWFHYATIRDLLSDLDLTFRQLDRLRPRHHNSQALVKKFGPYIMPDSQNADDDTDEICVSRVDGLKAYGLPAHMICYLPKQPSERRRDKKGDAYLEILLCAQKIGALPYLGKRKGKVFYEFCSVCMPNREEEEKGSLLSKPHEMVGYVEVDTSSGNFHAVKIPTCQ